MAFKLSELRVLGGFLARRALLRIFVFALTIGVLPLIQFMSINGDGRDSLAYNTDECSMYGGSGRKLFPGRFLKPFSFYPFPISGRPCEVSANLTSNIFRELRDKKMLNPGARALCVGEGSASAVSLLQALGFGNAFGAGSRLFPSLVMKGFDYRLSFENSSFDFVFSRSLDRSAVPALVVLEIERILRPGSFGAMLLRTTSGSNSGSMFKTAAPISAFVKSSDIVHVYEDDGFTLVAFKKRATPTDMDCLDELSHGRPEQCRSVSNNRGFLEHLEPLVNGDPVGSNSKQRFSYLPNLMNISTRDKLIYIDMGAGEFANSSIAGWFLTSYPMHSRSFNIYAVGSDDSVRTTYAKTPGITFVHFPGLLQEHATTEATPLELSSQALDWFKETVAGGDFVVLKVDAGKNGMLLLRKLFRTGAMCFIDELFFHCPDAASNQDTVCGDCFHFIEALRSSGVFVHRW